MTLAKKFNKMANIGNGIEFNLLQNFSGSENEDAKLWLTRFQLLVSTKGFNDNKCKTSLPLMFTGNALRWYLSLDDAIKNDYTTLKEAFLERYGPDVRTNWQRTAALYQERQGSQKVSDFIANLLPKATELGMPEDQVLNIVLNGLNSNLRPYVLQQNPTTLEQLTNAAKVAELTCGEQKQEQQTIMSAISRLENKLSCMELNMAAASRPDQQSREPHVKQHNVPAWNQQNNGPAWAGQYDDLPMRQQHNGPAWAGQYNGLPMKQQQNGPAWANQPERHRGRQQQQQPQRQCYFCGRYGYHNRQNCPANGKECRNCGKMDHFASVCRAVPRTADA